MLADVEVNLDDVSGWYNLHGCREAVCSDPASCARNTRDRPVPIMGYEHWPTCPIRLIRSPQWQAIARLYNAKGVSPLSGWPHAFAAWTVDALTELQAAFNRKEAAEVKKISGGGVSRGRR